MKRIECYLILKYYISNNHILLLCSGFRGIPPSIGCKSCRGEHELNISVDGWIPDVAQKLWEMEFTIHRVKVTTSPDEKSVNLFFITDNRYYVHLSFAS